MLAAPRGCQPVPRLIQQIREGAHPGGGARQALRTGRELARQEGEEPVARQVDVGHWVPRRLVEDLGREQVRVEEGTHDGAVDPVVPREAGGVQAVEPLERRTQEAAVLLSTRVGEVRPEAIVIVDADLRGVDWREAEVLGEQLVCERSKLHRSGC